MKKINVIGILYLIGTTLLILATLLMMFTSVASGAVSQFPWLLLLYIVSFAIGMFGMIWSSKLRAHKPWAWSWGIAFVGFNIIFGIVYFFIGLSIPGAIGFLFNIFVMYALITERQLFFPVQPGLEGQVPRVGRTLILPIIVFVILGIAGFFAYRAFISYSVGALKTDSSKINDILIQTSIIDTMVSAENYSMSRNGSFMGYQWPFASEVPQCSGGLTVNISTDGTKLAAMGKSCSNPSISYCEALPLVQSMMTILSSDVSSSKFDCGGGTQLPSETGFQNVMPFPIPNQSSSGSNSGSPANVSNKTSIEDVTPNGANITTLKVGDNYHITWSSTNLPSGAITSINLEVNGHKILIATNIPTGQNYYNWPVYRYPTDMTGPMMDGTKYDFSVSATYNGGSSYVANISSGFYLQ